MTVHLLFAIRSHFPSALKHATTGPDTRRLPCGGSGSGSPIGAGAIRPLGGAVLVVGGGSSPPSAHGAEAPTRSRAATATAMGATRRFTGSPHAWRENQDTRLTPLAGH